MMTIRERKEYLSSHSRQEAAAFFNVSVSTIGRWRRALDIKTSWPWNTVSALCRTLEKSSIEEITDYLETHTIADAAALFHVCEHTITRWRKHLAIVPRWSSNTPSALRRVLDTKTIDEVTAILSTSSGRIAGQTLGISKSTALEWKRWFIRAPTDKPQTSKEKILAFLAASPKPCAALVIAQQTALSIRNTLTHLNALEKHGVVVRYQTSLRRCKWGVAQK